MNDIHIEDALQTAKAHLLGGWKVQFAMMESMALTLRARHRGESDFGAWTMIIDPIDADADARPVVIGIGTYWAKLDANVVSATGDEWTVGRHGAPDAPMYRVRIATGPMRWINPRFDVDVGGATFEFDVAALEPLEPDNADNTPTDE